ncbi:MAG: CinA family protein [Burkholderiaceae bacterium]
MSAAQDDAVIRSAERLGRRLVQHGLMVATAESCTGGLIAAALTETAGASAWFDRGFVIYTNEAKMDLVSVRHSSLLRHGAVSEAVAQEMARGALAHSRAQLSVAVTGIAGPGGGSADKPVGTVCFAWALEDSGVRTATRHFDGDRANIRMLAARYALEEALALLDAAEAARTTA